MLGRSLHPVPEVARRLIQLWIIYRQGRRGAWRARPVRIRVQGHRRAPTLARSRPTAAGACSVGLVPYSERFEAEAASIVGLAGTEGEGEPLGQKTGVADLLLVMFLAPS